MTENFFLFSIRKQMNPNDPNNTHIYVYMHYFIIYIYYFDQGISDNKLQI